jgi:hypothetical protein
MMSSVTAGTSCIPISQIIEATRTIDNEKLRCPDCKPINIAPKMCYIYGLTTRAPKNPWITRASLTTKPARTQKKVRKKDYIHPALRAEVQDGRLRERLTGIPK